MGLAREVGWTPFAETTSSYAEITLLFFFRAMKITLLLIFYDKVEVVVIGDKVCSL